MVGLCFFLMFIVSLWSFSISFVEVLSQFWFYGVLCVCGSLLSLFVEVLCLCVILFSLFLVILGLCGSFMTL